MHYRATHDCNLSQFIVIEGSIHVYRNYEDVFEIHIVEVITKPGSPCLPYLGVIKMLQSVYGCDNKNNIN